MMQEMDASIQHEDTEETADAEKQVCFFLKLQQFS